MRGRPAAVRRPEADVEVHHPQISVRPGGGEKEMAFARSDYGIDLGIFGVDLRPHPDRFRISSVSPFRKIDIDWSRSMAGGAVRAGQLLPAEKQGAVRGQGRSDFIRIARQSQTGRRAFLKGLLHDKIHRIRFL